MEARYASTAHPMMGFGDVKSIQLAPKSQLKCKNSERPKNASDQAGELELTHRERENSDSKTLFSKDCSLGSFRPV